MKKKLSIKEIEDIIADLEREIYDPPENEIYDIDDADILALSQEKAEASLKYYQRLLKKEKLNNNNI